MREPSARSRPSSAPLVRLPPAPRVYLAPPAPDRIGVVAATYPIFSVGCRNHTPNVPGELPLSRESWSRVALLAEQPAPGRDQLAGLSRSPRSGGVRRDLGRVRQQRAGHLPHRGQPVRTGEQRLDRKSTRLNSS